MAQMQIRGSTQIISGTVPASALVSSLNLPTSQLQDGALFIKSDGSVSMAASLNAGGHTIINGATPVNPTDFAIKSYVDGLVNGLTLHPFCRVVSVNNQALTGTATVDGVALNAGDRILLTAQTTTSQNGPWVVESGSWVRPSDWASGAVLNEGAYFLIDPDGTVYKNTKWFALNTGSITVDTTAVTFSQDLSGTVYSAGNGLSLAGVSFSAKLGNGLQFDGSENIAVLANGSSLNVSSSGIEITNGTAGQVMLAGSGGAAAFTTVTGDVTVASNGAVTLVTSGVSAGQYGNVTVNAKGLVTSATTVNTVTYGGTGVSTLTGLAKGNGTAAFSAAVAGSDYSTGTAALGSGLLYSTTGTGVLSIATVGEFPILNQNTTGNAATVTTIPTLSGDVTNSGNVVSVNNTAGSGFIKYTNFVAAEVAGGSINSTNTAFTLANTPQWLQLYLNGMLLQPGTGNDFTISGANVTMLYAPVTGDKLLAWYTH